MYKLISAFFLTESEQDVGFPAFQSSRENLLYTCTLDKELNILSFLPIYDDRFHFIPISDSESQFGLGDNFPFLFFRLGNSNIEIVNLNAVEENVDSFMNNHQNFPFIRLQIARYFSRQNRSRAVKAISDAAATFKLDEDSKLSFISSETSLVSFENGLWEAIRPEIQSAVTDDEIFYEFEQVEKIHAMNLLQSGSFKSSQYWPYLFLVYASRFGTDEFWYILGKEYVRKLMLHDVLPAKIAARVLNHVLDYHSDLVRNRQPADRDFSETIRDFVETDAFDAIAKLEPSLIQKCLPIMLGYEDSSLDSVNTFFDFIASRNEWLQTPMLLELISELKVHVRNLDDGDLIRFSGAFFEPTERDREKLSDLSQTRSRLQSFVLNKLSKSLLGQAPINSARRMD